MTKKSNVAQLLAARSGRLYKQAKDMAPVAPLASRVLCNAVDRGVVPVGFWDRWLQTLSEDEKCAFLDEVDSLLLVAITSTDGPDNLKLSNPKTPERFLNINVAGLRQRFGGVQA